ncbi:calponin homology domain-containing protein DDB_G0272472-like [Aedes albopictus]|uniref:Reverse transcriptase domain-containing protein n=1 Tax=Aedes albopictus TaxID=7160 RepID=A0ABM1Y1G9_AEDAL
MDPLFAHCKPYISSNEHGFMPGRSTATNLCLTSQIIESMSKRVQTDLELTLGAFWVRAGVSSCVDRSRLTVSPVVFWTAISSEDDLRESVQSSRPALRAVKRDDGGSILSPPSQRRYPPPSSRFTPSSRDEQQHRVDEEKPCAEDEVDYELRLRKMRPDKRESLEDKRRLLRRLVNEDRKLKVSYAPIVNIMEDNLRIEKKIAELDEMLNKKIDYATVSRLRHYLTRAARAATTDDVEVQVKEDLYSRIQEIFKKYKIKIKNPESESEEDQDKTEQKDKTEQEREEQERGEKENKDREWKEQEQNENEKSEPGKTLLEQKQREKEDRDIEEQTRINKMKKEQNKGGKVKSHGNKSELELERETNDESNDEKLQGAVRKDRQRSKLSVIDIEDLDHLIEINHKIDANDQSLYRTGQVSRPEIHHLEAEEDSDDCYSEEEDTPVCVIQNRQQQNKLRELDLTWTSNLTGETVINHLKIEKDVLPVGKQPISFSVHFMEKSEEAEELVIKSRPEEDDSLDVPTLDLPKDPGKFIENVETEHELSEPDRERLKQVLKRFACTSENQLGRTTLLEHHIELVEGTNLKDLPMYRYAPKIWDKIEAELERWKELNVIEECVAEYANPLVPVRKANGKIRVCLDSRRINSITKKDAYPMRNMSEIFHRLKKAKYFSVIDLKDAYFQIPLNEKSRDYTAFRTPKGLFRFKVVPFGLKNAPFTMNRLMNRAFGFDLEPKVFTYLDDIIIATETLEEHFRLLEEVAKRLRNAGLTISVEKTLGAFWVRAGVSSCVDRSRLTVSPVVFWTAISSEDDLRESVQSSRPALRAVKRDDGGSILSPPSQRRYPPPSSRFTPSSRDEQQHRVDEEKPCAEDEVDYELRLRKMRPDKRESLEDKRRLLRRLVNEDRKLKVSYAPIVNIMEDNLRIEKKIAELDEMLNKKIDYATVSRLRHYLTRAARAATTDDVEVQVKEDLYSRIQEIFKKYKIKIKNPESESEEDQDKTEQKDKTEQEREEQERGEKENKDREWKEQEQNENEKSEPGKTLLEQKQREKEDRDIEEQTRINKMKKEQNKGGKVKSHGNKSELELERETNDESNDEKLQGAVRKDRQRSKLSVIDIEDLDHLIEINHKIDANDQSLYRTGQVSRPEIHHLEAEEDSDDCYSEEEDTPVCVIQNRQQ